MKIEKISDNQIRCTLNKEDLIDRELRISELAYGTEKAKALFRDMMQQASYEFGFEAEDIPLMIEAIPVSPECLILVITKVEDPDELDTRFSKFSSDHDDTTEDYEADENDAYADEIINCFGQIDEILDNSGDTAMEEKNFVPLPETISEKKIADTSTKSEKIIPSNGNFVKVYSFHSLDEICKLSTLIVHAYNGKNTVYKDPSNDLYYLMIEKSNHSAENFNKICNVISEYGKSERITYASFAYYQEHFEPIIKKRAVQVLANL